MVATYHVFFGLIKSIFGDIKSQTLNLYIFLQIIPSFMPKWKKKKIVTIKIFFLFILITFKKI